MFSKHGFNGTTTRKLAQRAGISEALLFRHFPDKQKLYAAILQFKMEEQLPVIFSDLPAEEGPETLLKVLARRIARLHEDDPSFLRLLLFSSLENHRLSDLFFTKRELPLIEFLKGYFEKMTAQGRMRMTDPEDAAYAFMAMIIGFAQSRTLFHIPQVSKDKIESRVERYVDIFLQGVRP